MNITSLRDALTSLPLPASSSPSEAGNLSRRAEKNDAGRDTTDVTDSVRLESSRINPSKINQRDLSATKSVAKTAETFKATEILESTQTQTKGPFAPHLSEQDESDKDPLQKKLEEIVETTNQSLEQYHSIRFEIDKELDNTIVVQVIDQKTDELIRQIPSEEMLRLARQMQETQALLYDRRGAFQPSETRQPSSLSSLKNVS